MQFCVLYFLFLQFFILFWKKFQLLYLTLVTSCIIGPFLCCNLLFLIINLVISWCSDLTTIITFYVLCLNYLKRHKKDILKTFKKNCITKKNSSAKILNKEKLKFSFRLKKSLVCSVQSRKIRQFKKKNFIWKTCKKKPFNDVNA